jgi:RNA polymerase sigma-70 factor (ECF subfamily)
MPRIADIPIPESVASAARHGDERALETVYRATAGPIYTLLRRLVRRPAIAEELLQETFVDVLEHIGAFEGRCPLAAWIRSIAVNRALMYLRSPWHRSLEWLDADAGRLEGLQSDSPSAARSSEPSLDRALMRLPALSRAVVWLHDVEGYTHTEIGTALGRTPSFSKTQLSRAHARLRDLLADAETMKEGAACTPT